MRLHDFDYDLPEELIAKTPMAQRSDSRLLCVDGVSGRRSHQQFRDILDLLAPGDLLVFNDTRVIPARVYGHKLSGGKIEVLVERVIDDRQVLAHIKASKSPKAGATLVLEDGTEVVMLRREGELFALRFPEGATVFDVLERIGHMPLPPYIDREDEALDRERYQTVYSRNMGAVAAPTAGLHFDQELLDALTAKGVEFAFVTLHVGAGTFQPVRVDNVREHQMHSEVMYLSEQTCEHIKRVKAAGKRVVAVGTTSVRCLETAAAQAQKDEPHSRQGSQAQAQETALPLGMSDIAPYQGETDIFIYPGYEFRIVDMLITNFHLPQSTLLMLVSAFSGYETMMAAYKEAVEARYRFFSYGDAMLLGRNPLAPGEEIARSASGSTGAVDANK